MDAPPDKGAKKETGTIIATVVCALIAARVGLALFPDAAHALGFGIFGVLSAAVGGVIGASIWFLGGRLFRALLPRDA